MIALSLGAGVQSSTLALMLARGDLGPMPDCAIFADTQGEPASVYRWLDWLEAQLPYPVYRATAGSLAEKAVEVRTGKNDKRYTKSSVPAFIVGETGAVGFMMRQCTNDYKIVVIKRQLRTLIGRKRNAKVVQLIGISADEVHRMKPSRDKWITNQWPLVDAGIRRSDCIAWMAKCGYPTPPRSACVFCPYHNDREWLRLKTKEPEEFQKAVEFETRYKAAMAKTKMRGTPYLHRSLVPLSEVVFGAADGQLDMFGNECEGMCGV